MNPGTTKFRKYVSWFLSYHILQKRTMKKNKECALAHSRACGGRLRHLHCTSQCASPRSVFDFTGKQFPVKQKSPRVSGLTTRNTKDSRIPAEIILTQAELPSRRHPCGFRSLRYGYIHHCGLHTSERFPRTSSSAYQQPWCSSSCPCSPSEPQLHRT